MKSEIFLVAGVVLLCRVLNNAEFTEVIPSNL
jgi:hypothetical protein